MTRFEQIAAAFPLHAQRIAEATYQYRGEVGLCRLMTEPSDVDDVGYHIGSLFVWAVTDEGDKYWFALYSGLGVA